jgi:hypothetical protein
VDDDSKEAHSGQEPEKGGQILGCVFAAFAVGIIFLILFFFMSSC